MHPAAGAEGGDATVDHAPWPWPRGEARLRNHSLFEAHGGSPAWSWARAVMGGTTTALPLGSGGRGQKSTDLLSEFERIGMAAQPLSLGLGGGGGRTAKISCGPGWGRRYACQSRPPVDAEGVRTTSHPILPMAPALLPDWA